MLAAAGLLGSSLTACSVKVESKATVSAADLQKDLTDRLTKDGNAPKSVTCNEDLAGEVGKTAKCEVVLSEANSVEAVFTAVKVEGTTVSYEIAPELTKEQLQKVVAGMDSNPNTTVVCDSGVDGKVGARAKCEVTRNGMPSKTAVEVMKVSGLAMDLNVSSVLPKQKIQETLIEQMASAGQPAETADCIDDVIAKVGSSLECTVSSGGQSQVYIVTVTDPDAPTVDYKQKP